MSLDLTTIADRVAASVVGLRSGSRRGSRSATGLVVADGTIITPAHNVRGELVSVRFVDGSVVDATVTARSEEHDLAVLAADTAAATPAAYGDPAAVPVGADIAAIAAPDGTARITAGTVATTAAKLRTRSGSPLAGLIEHTAPLPRGASGGPVLDADGAVVGLNTNRLQGGLYQAVPADARFRTIVQQLASGTVPQRRRLGVRVVPSEQAAWLRGSVGLPPRAGALISGVESDGPGGRAGLARGDLVVAVNGTAISDPDDLLVALRDAEESSELTVGRGAEEDRAVQVDFAASAAD